MNNHSKPFFCMANRIAAAVLALSFLLGACAPQAVTEAPAATVKTEAAPEEAQQELTEEPVVEEIVELPPAETFTLPEDLLIYAPTYLQDWEAALLEAMASHFEDQGVQVEMNWLSYDELIAAVQAGDLPDLLFSPWQLHDQIAALGAELILSTTGSTPDVWRPVVLTREDTGITRLSDLPGHTMAGYVDFWQMVAGLGAAGVVLENIEYSVVSQENAVDLLLGESVDAAVIGNWGLNDFYEMDMEALMGLRVVGYGLPIPATVGGYAGPNLDEEGRRAVQAACIQNDFNQPPEIGFSWGDHEGADQLINLRDAANAVLPEPSALTELQALLQLDQDQDEDGVPDLMDECPYTPETAEEDNTIQNLGRDGCPCVWREGASQILHLLEPALTPLDEELSLLAQLADAYGYTDVASHLSRAAAAAAESRPEDLIEILEAIPASAFDGAKLASLAGVPLAGDSREKDLGQWLEDKIGITLKIVNCFASRWSDGEDIYSSLKYVLKKTGGLVNVKLAQWTALMRTKFPKFATLLKGIEGFSKVMGVTGNILFIYKHSDKYWTSYFEARSIVESDPTRDFMLTLHERLKVNYGTDAYVWEAIWDLVPKKALITAANFLVRNLPDIGPPPTSPIKMVYTRKEVNMIKDSMACQKEMDLPEHLTEQQEGTEKYIRYSQYPGLRMTGDWKVNITEGGQFGDSIVY